MKTTQPVVLFPLRLEIDNHGKKNVSSIRWYPDESQLFPPVSGQTDADRKAFQEYELNETEIENDASLSDKEREIRLRTSWLALVRKVGLARARWLVDEKYSGGSKTFSGKSDKDALHAFLEEGAPLKMLPERVFLFTLRWQGGTRIIELLERGEIIPADIVFSLQNQQNPSGTNWVFNFEKAVKVGMGVRITDPVKINQLRQAGWLLAVGCKADTTENAVLEELLLRNKSLGSMEILAQDTPTNNTEQASTDFIGNENGTSRESEMPQEPGITDGAASGDLLAAALGLERSVFGGVKNEASRDQRAALAMNRILWFVCTRDHRDAFLNFNTPKGLYRMKDRFEEWMALSEHFTRYVIGRGLLPSIRIGDNPYGILPVTDLEAWKPFDEVKGDSIAQSMVDVCRILKKKSLKLANGEQQTSYYVPGLDTVPDSRKLNTLLQILQHNAVSHRVDIQRVSEGEGQQTRFDADPRRFPNPLVSAVDVPDNILNLAREYRNFAANGRISDDAGAPAGDAFKRALIADLPKIPLMEWLLRYQLVSLEADCDQYRQDAVDLKTKGDAAGAKRKLELCDILSAYALRIVKELDEIKGVSTQQMEILFLEVLDCLSHRLDAWVCSLAHRRLAKITDEGTLKRRTAPHNYIGAYGWLEKPFDTNKPHDSKGFFQAPSLNQATAGVLLRNAALNGNGNNAFQTNLSSERARKAVWFFEGMQKGFTPAELYGYRAERLLHEQGLDQYIPELRAYYPLTGQNEQGQTIDNSVIINGEALMNGVTSSVPGAVLTIKTSDLNTVKNELLKVRDAVSDLSIAEAVYQAVRGNAPRATAWLEVAEGKNVPPEQEILTTPRTGTVKVQKVVLPLVNDPADADRLNPRVLADPAVAGFCTAQTNNVSTAVFKITVSARDSKKEVYATPLSLKELGMTPIDLVVGGKAELETRARAFLCGHFARNRGIFGFLGDAFFAIPLPQTLDERAFVEFEYDYPVNAAPLFKDLFAVVERLQLFLAGVQPFTIDDVLTKEYLAADQQYLESIVDSKLQTYEMLLSRGKKLADNFFSDLEQFETLRATADPSRDELQEILNRFIGYGVFEAFIPPEPSLLTPLDEALQIHAKRFTGGIDSVTLEVKGRAPLTVRLMANNVFQQKVNNMPDTWEEVADVAIRLAAGDAYIEAAVALLKERTQKTMPVFPPVSLIETENIARPAPNSPDNGRNFSVGFIADGLKEYGNVRNNIDLALQLFPGGRDGNGLFYLIFSRIGIQRTWEEALTQAFDTEGKAKPPLAPPKGWIQSNVDMHYIVPERGMMQESGNLFTALLVDEWTDFTANPQESTAVAIHYPVPKNEAPHVLLLAVPPKGEWGQHLTDELAGVLAETIDLMKMRSVCGEMVTGSNLGYILPALLYYGVCTHLPSEKYELYGKNDGSNGLLETGFYYNVDKKP